MSGNYGTMPAARSSLRVSLTRTVSLLLALAFAGPLAAEDQPGVEAAFVRCIIEKDPKLALAIRDAPSEQAFTDSIKKATELCPVDANQLSLGRFFGALNAALKAGKAN